MKLKTELNKPVKFLESHLNSTTKLGLGIVAILAVGYTISSFFPENDVTKSSVMVVNVSKQNGGSGVILKSTDTGSTILTNSHVCRVIEKGGSVVHNNSQHKVFTYKHSLTHDLCLITVKSNLGVNTKIASNTPTSYYEKAFISGHPNLLPNVVTSGHFSGKMLIQVLTGIKKCTEEKEFEKFPDLCILLGGIPQIKEYESTLVTATIMPGSSGSGVYNEKQQLVGLAFAGGRDFSYAWTVPFEDVKFFLEFESKVLAELKPDEVNPVTASREENHEEAFNKLKDFCSNPDKAVSISSICKAIQRDLLWRH